jgi:PAS domain-containing protein
MAVVDRDGLVVTANDTFGALLGKAGPEGLTGRIAADLVDLPRTPVRGTRTARCCAAGRPD